MNTLFLTPIDSKIRAYGDFIGISPATSLWIAILDNIKIDGNFVISDSWFQFLYLK